MAELVLVQFKRPELVVTGKQALACKILQPCFSKDSTQQVRFMPKLEKFHGKNPKPNIVDIAPLVHPFPISPSPPNPKPTIRSFCRPHRSVLGGGGVGALVLAFEHLPLPDKTWRLAYPELHGQRVIERRGVFYIFRFVAHPVFPTPANVSCIVQKLRLKIVGLRRSGKK